MVIGDFVTLTYIHSMFIQMVNQLFLFLYALFHRALKPGSLHSAVDNF